MTTLEVLKDQRQELERGIRNTVLVPREAEKTINSHSRLIQVVSGVRRCGKSVLIYKILQGQEFGYVNFDDDRLLQIKPNEILGRLYQMYGKQLNTIFFDEIQNLEHWELFVNRLHRAGFRIFLTGSNAKLLAREMATHLTGRHHTIELWPFSFREYLMARNFQEDLGTTQGKSLAARHFQEYMQRGGFPEVVMGREEPASYLKELYQKIIERDIVSRYNIMYKKTLREITGSVMSNPGRYLSYGKLRRQFGLGSDHTVKNYLSYLEEAYLIVFLSKFSFKPAEIEKSEKKVYSIDTGMANSVSLQTGSESSHFYENIVALELLRRQRESYYWKNPEQEEVDFVLRAERRVIQLIQVCYHLDESSTKREIRALLKASKALRCKSLLIITAEREGKEKVEWFGLTGTVEYLPLWKWLLTTS
ncbi:ATP-binding protein [Candidatus Woesearchaeota archaeon]|nr:ATP-binding protein [Candidatus Woesearchaeota archaeon]